jgi:hypothetical protein
VCIVNQEIIMIWGVPIHCNDIIKLFALICLLSAYTIL